MSDDEQVGDLDAELLALAGDDESSDDEEPVTEERKASKSPSRSPSPTKLSPSPQPPSPTRRGVAQRKTKSATRDAPQSQIDESEEEGEASSIPGSPNSLGSGAMSESESDTSPNDDADDGVLFPLEGKYYNEKDKAYVLSLPEIKREEIIADRLQQLEVHTQNQHLRRRAREREEAEAADKRKRKADTAELDDAQRKSTRQKTRASESLEAYKRQRQQRGEQRRRQQRNLERRRAGASRSPSRDRQSDIDAEGESEQDYKPKTIPDVPGELKDFHRVHVGRENFARYCFYPTFEELITGCYVRVCIGMNNQSGLNIYRMAQIKGFKTKTPYVVTTQEGKSFMTDQWVIAKIGSLEKEWPFTTCSNSRPTEDEFRWYKEKMEQEHFKLPIKAFLNNKIDDINSLTNHRFTDEEIQRKIERQNKYADRVELRNNSRPKPTESSERDKRLMDRNKENRRLNAEEVRKAQIRARRQAEVNRVRLAREMQEKEETAKRTVVAKPGHSQIDDLFDDGLGSPATPGIDGTPNGRSPGSAEQENKRPLKEKKTGIPTFHKPKTDDDYIAALDLDIHIEI